MAEFLAKKNRRLLQQMQAFPPGFWIVAIVITLIGGRFFWVRASQLPPHRQKIVDAFGSAVLFSTMPQINSTGKKFTFVKTTANGFGLFLGDAVTGKKVSLYEQPGSMQVLPWSPDDSSFIYSVSGQLNICDPVTGKVMANVKIPPGVKALTWLTPNEFICFDTSGSQAHLYDCQKQSNGTWTQKDKVVKVNITGAPALRSTGGIGTASGDDAAEKVFDQSEMTAWSSGNPSGSAWLQYQFNGPAWAITQYKLTSSTNDANADPRDWKLLGSDNGTNWTTLDVCANEIFTSRGQTRQFTFRNQVPYRFYRLNVTATAGRGSNGVQLAKFQLWSADSHGEASANSENGVAEGAMAAFDGSTRTKWLGEGTGWLQYKFGGGAAWEVSQYSLTSANDVPNRDPKDWQFQASNDGNVWTNLDMRTGEIFEFRSQTKTYSFTNPAAYRFYRLNITANRGGGKNGTQLSEFHLGIEGMQVAAPVDLAKVALSSTPLFSSGIFYLTALSSNTIAWGQGNRIWSMNLTRTTPDLLLDVQSALPENTTLRSFDYSKETGQFLLSCAQPEGGSLWVFNPAEPSSGLHKIATTATPIKDGIWLNKDSDDGWICLSGKEQNNYILATQASSTEPARLLPDANIDTLTQTADGRRLFFLGTVSHEPSAGIWQYDLDSNQLRCLIPYGDRISAYAKGVDYVSNSLVMPSGEKLNFFICPPPNSGNSPTHKYPLVIADSPMGITASSTHGRLFAPAIAACGAYVVIIDRPGGWFNGIEKWSDNVMAVYQHLLDTNPSIDTNRVFLLGVSAETQYTSALMTEHPNLWKGAILHTASALPDPSIWPVGQRRPKILILAAALDMDDARLENYQEAALKTGVEVDVVIFPNEEHHLTGNAAQLRGIRAMANFVFDE